MLKMQFRISFGPRPSIFFLLLLYPSLFSLIASQRSPAPNATSPWLTLSGNPPVVIANGGFSGIFPSSSVTAYQSALLTSLPDVILWCDVQMTKDGNGICAPELLLDKCTNINTVFNDTKTYLVNGVPMTGFFSVDYTLDDLSNVFLIQGNLARTDQFDNDANSISTMVQVVKEVKPPSFWLNIQHDLFFGQHNLSMTKFVLSVSRRVIINYISSPEVGFLTNIARGFNGSKTKLIFRFLGRNDIEPTTNQTYDSLLKNLTFIKTFASGILVPKYYIWPINPELYLQPHTFIVLDAHKQGLEIFASDLTNDIPLSYNYSYDPLAESLSYIDNGDFSVDGMLTDFPVTSSVAIGCFSHVNKNSSESAKPVIISHNGASGIYPGCTDLAYQQAVDDGTDIIDCSVQMTRDGVPICLNSTNLVDSTTVIQSSFTSRLMSIPEIQGGTAGIFTFNLTWDEIKTLKPAISNPFLKYTLSRNPAYANEGNFLTLDDFLTFAKDKSISGLLINIENAAYLVEKQGLSVIDSVVSALSKAGYDNQTRLGVTIQSTNSSVLKKFKQLTKYKRMYMLDESISDALNSSIEDIKQVADSVAITKDSIFHQSAHFITDDSNIVAKLQSFGLEVYAYPFTNEFVSQAWDFYSDPSVEINAFVQGVGVDGIITDFPGTARAYRRNACLKMGKHMPKYMNPVQGGALFEIMSPDAQPPAEPPFSLLKDSDVVEPPLPNSLARSPTAGTGGNASSPSSTASGQPHNAVTCITLSLILLLGSLLFIN